MKFNLNYIFIQKKQLHNKKATGMKWLPAIEGKYRYNDLDIANMSCARLLNRRVSQNYFCFQAKESIILIAKKDMVPNLFSTG